MKRVWRLRVYRRSMRRKSRGDVEDLWGSFARKGIGTGGFKLSKSYIPPFFIGERELQNQIQQSHENILNSNIIFDNSFRETATKTIITIITFRVS